MRPEVLETLSTIPFVGPLFYGNSLAVSIKLLVLVAVAVTAVIVLRAVQRRLTEAQRAAERKHQPRRVAQVTPLPAELEWQPPAQESTPRDPAIAVDPAREGQGAGAQPPPAARPSRQAPAPRPREAAPELAPSAPDADAELEPRAPAAGARPSRQQARHSAPPAAVDLSIDSPVGTPDELVASSAGADDDAVEGDSSRRSQTPSPSEVPLPRPPTDARELEARFGTEVNRRYELLEELGRGGMAEVYKARDRALGRIIALKFLSPNLVGDANAMRLFAREARAAAALNHPAIVTIYDLGVVEGRPFISMEFVEGTDLRTLLSEKRTLQLATCVELGIRLADALDFAHERHVVHRDVKPANVIVSPSTGGGVAVKLLDFGVAKAIQGGRGAASMLAGTPQYMAPEQLSQGEIDGRADLFSLGVLLYRALTGKRPFHGLERHHDVKPLSTHAPWVPAELDQVVRRAIALDPDERYQRGRDMAAALAGSLKNIADIDDGPTVFEPESRR